jgi:membrane associated rhomboid family serine protease
VLSGLPQLSSERPDVSAGVAVWAHIGGFAAGLLLIKLFVNPRLTAERDLTHSHPSLRRW